MISKVEMQKIIDITCIPVLECPKCGTTLYVHPFRLPDNVFQCWCDECKDYVFSWDLVKE